MCRPGRSQPVRRQIIVEPMTSAKYSPALANHREPCDELHGSSRLTLRDERRAPCAYRPPESAATQPRYDQLFVRRAADLKSSSPPRARCVRPPCFVPSGINSSSSRARLPDRVHRRAYRQNIRQVKIGMVGAAVRSRPPPRPRMPIRQGADPRSRHAHLGRLILTTRIVAPSRVGSAVRIHAGSHPYSIRTRSG